MAQKEKKVKLQVGMNRGKDGEARYMVGKLNNVWCTVKYTHSFTVNLV